jgi:hypothetical protein
VPEWRFHKDWEEKVRVLAREEALKLLEPIKERLERLEREKRVE